MVLLILATILLCLVFCSNAFSAPRKKLLVLGGTGFVGNKVAFLASKNGFKVVAVSRRGRTRESVSSPNIEYVSADAGSLKDMERVFAAYGPFDGGIVHAIGLLLDSDSGLSSLNKFVSGSGSVPGSASSYDRITRQTSFNAIDSALKQQEGQSQETPLPFVFVSAAEAGWDFPAPIRFLERYLVAKRAVEGKLMSAKPVLKPVVMRPSLIYTWSRPQAMLSVVPFFIASKIGIPFVDRPVNVETLSKAIIAGIKTPSVQGIHRIDDMELAAEAFSGEL